MCDSPSVVKSAITVSQDVVTQEPTSLEVAVRTLEMQLEDNLEVDIIPDMHWT